MTRAILLVALLSACAAPSRSDMDPTRITLGAGDFADAGTTAIGLGMGFSEANPLASWAGDAVPFVGLALKYGVKHILVAAGETVEAANRQVESVGWGAACANAMTISGVSLPAALVAGLVCNRVYVGGVK